MSGKSDPFAFPTDENSSPEVTPLKKIKLEGAAELKEKVIIVIITVVILIVIIAVIIVVIIITIINIINIINVLINFKIISIIISGG